MLTETAAHIFIILVFGVGYLAIIFENSIKINKTASALLMAVFTWMFFFLLKGAALTDSVATLGERLGDVTQIIFFLLGAMTLVELVDSHEGFRIITDVIQTNSKRKLLWIIGLVTFFLSAIFDNLATTIVMISLLRKLVSERSDRLLLGAMVVIAANAGGAWSPIGDVTTTMLWINGNVTTAAVMKSLFFPSFFSFALALVLFGWNLKGRYANIVAKAHKQEPEPGARSIFWCGLGGLIFVPLFKTLTGLPPFMGILIALGILWIITDLMHYKYERREHLLVPHILTKIDTSGILFFLGILLCIGSLDAIGILRELAEFLDRTVGNMAAIATLIGLLSAVVDNVPLVAAGMGMYSLESYPVDSSFWQMLAYCAGTGGSVLIIGSAAGVAFMGMEKVSFLWYLKRASLIALLSYLFGMGVYLLQQAII